MTLPLIKVADHDVQFNFDEIAKRFVDTGGRQIKMRFGSGTVTWPGGASTSGANTVSHGLGSTPVAVFVQDNGSVAGLAHVAVWTANTLGATTFQAVAETSDTTNPALGTQRGFYWIAIG